MFASQLIFYQNEADYSQLTESGKQMVDGMVQAYLDTLTDPSVFTPDNLDSLITDALEYFKATFGEAVDQSAREMSMGEEFFGELFTNSDEALQKVLLDF